MIARVVPHGNHEAEVLIILRCAFVAFAATTNANQIRGPRLGKECLGWNVIVGQRFRAPAINANVAFVFSVGHGGMTHQAGRARPASERVEDPSQVPCYVSGLTIARVMLRFFPSNHATRSVAKLGAYSDATMVISSLPALVKATPFTCSSFA